MATNVSSTTGATIGIVATIPTTYDGNATTGYTPLTFTDIAEVIDCSEVAKVYAVLNHQAAGRAYAQKIKDTYDISNVTLTLGRYLADTGQALLTTAHGSSASYSFEIAMPSGDIVNFTAKVIKVGFGGFAAAGVTSTMVELAIDPETLYEA